MYSWITASVDRHPGCAFPLAQFSIQSVRRRLVVEPHRYFDFDTWPTDASCCRLLRRASIAGSVAQQCAGEREDRGDEVCEDLPRVAWTPHRPVVPEAFLRFGKNQRLVTCNNNPRETNRRSGIQVCRAIMPALLSTMARSEMLRGLRDQAIEET